MPKQGEQYELLVRDVYRILNYNGGLENVAVRHNVLLDGNSRKHQIDVYWEFSCGTVTYKVAVECKDYSRSVSAEKIEAFAFTLLDIGGIKGIFVSRNGFQTGAVQVAQKYGIQLMQIREPLASDWDGYIKDIYINFKFNSIENIRPYIFVDKTWAYENHIDEHKFRVSHGWTDNTYVVEDKGKSSEKRISLVEIINKIPREVEGNDQEYIEKYADAYFECDDTCLKINGIKFVYDIRYTNDQLHIDAMNVVKTVINNVISGESLYIDVQNNVKKFNH